MGNSQQKQNQNPQNPQEKTEEKVQENSNSIFTCEICIEPMLETQKFNNKYNCKHPFCLDCIAKYIEVKLQDNTPKILCPGLNCENLLDPISCTDLISPTLFVKWCDLLCDGLVSWSDSSYCPNRDCKELVVNECGGVAKESKCPNCKELFCFQCKIKWVDGHDCHETTEQIRRDLNEILFKELMEKKKWVKCPGCGHCVERLRGCFRVKCRCLTRFCYNCGRKLSNDSCDCNFLTDENYDVPRYVYICITLVGIALFIPTAYLGRHELGF